MESESRGHAAAGAEIGAPLADGRRPWRYEGRALNGSSRPLRANGVLPAAGERAPWVVLAVGRESPRERHQRWCDGLAKEGYATLVFEPETDEAWWRHADALEQLIRLIRLDATTPGLGCHGVLDAERVVLIGEGTGAAAAARAAAELPLLDGVLFADPFGAATVLPWLTQIAAPVAVVATGAPQAAEAQRWHAAARNGNDTRWLVTFDHEHGLPRNALPRQPILERSVRELCTTFVSTQLPRSAAPAGSFAKLARRGPVVRTVEFVHNGARVSLASAPDAARDDSTELTPRDE